MYINLNKLRIYTVFALQFIDTYFRYYNITHFIIYLYLFVNFSYSNDRCLNAHLIGQLSEPSFFFCSTYILVQEGSIISFKFPVLRKKKMLSGLKWNFIFVLYVQLYFTEI